MDPLTQSLLGAAAAHAAVGSRLGRIAALCGAVGGELPDLDVFIPADPALPMEYHRHFTHAIAFIPIGGALAALPFLLAPSLRRRWKLVLAATTIGCATHGLLDVCTSYGTYLLWPFIDRRLSWDIISIIDPVFTLTLLIGVVWAVIARRGRPAAIALSLALGWLGLGVVQHHRAAGVQQRLAAERGHEIERSRVMPMLGNLVVWRSLYESNGRIYADAVRVGGPGGAAARAGTSTPVFRLDDLSPTLASEGRVVEVFEAFHAFADGYVARVPGADSATAVLGDMRYSLDAGGFTPLWGIAVTASNPHPQVRWVSPTHLQGRRQALLEELVSDVVRGEGFTASGR